jgi:nucleoside-diphosphate-sugar epimerase
MGTTVAVTGAAGFVGSTVCGALLAQGYDVIGIDAFIDYYPRRLKEVNLAGLLGQPGFTFVETDLRWDDLLPCLVGVDVILHAAAMPGLAKSWSNFDLYSSCNLLATQRLAEAARIAGVRKLVYVSTSSVYGAYAVGDESMPTRPVSPYGVTKLAAEHLLEAYHETLDLPVVVLRYFSVYGPAQRPDMAFNIFTEAMLDGLPITVFGDGSASRSSTYIDDCVRATVAAIESGPTGEIFNVGGGEVRTLLESVHLIAETLGTRPHIVYRAPRDGDQVVTAADTSKAGRILGYEPQVRMREGLPAQVQWQRARRRIKEQTG